MAVASPISAAAKSAAAGADAIPVTAPAAGLSLRFMVTGVLALAAGMGWLVARPDLLAAYHYNQNVIALTHLLVLGWIGSIVMGALYQLVPVALETRLYSERLARWQFVFHVVGFTGMVWMFRVWNLKQVGHFASLLALGVGLLVYNLARTLRRAPKWNVTAAAITAALFWISLAVTAGLFIAAAKSAGATEAGLTPANPEGLLLHGLKSVARFMSRFDALSTMHAHAHLGAVGCFTMLIVGVSCKLVPMFTLSEVQSRRRAAWSVGLLNLGLAGSFATILLRSPWKLAFALVVVAALAIHAWELAAIVRARERRQLDWGIKYFLTAIGLLLPVAVLAAVLSWPGLRLNALTGQLENVYGFLGLAGVITLAIIGMLYKIVPFLVWYAAYSRHVGRAQVPALADMYSARLQSAGFWAFLAGLGVTCAGIITSNATVVRCGCVLLAVSVTTLTLNVGRMLAHFVRPRLQPFPLSPANQPRPA